MLVSVMSVKAVGVWVGFGSGVTWCHSVCMFCDPVVTPAFVVKVICQWRKHVFLLVVPK